MSDLTEQKNYKVCLAAIEAKKDIEWRFLSLGKMLYEIKAGRLYEAGWDSWDTYCMDLKLSQTSISKLLNIYEVFVLHYKIEPEKLAEAGGWSSIAELLPLIKTETTPVERVHELLGIAIAQPRKDLRKSIYEIKKGKACAHKKTHRLVLEICDDCPERWRIEE